MITKVFEVRDSATHMGVMATKIHSSGGNERSELRRCGYGMGSPLVIVTDLNNPSNTSYDPYKFDTTLFHAAKYIMEHFDELATGDVVDVEFIIGKTSKPKLSEN